MNFIQFTSLRYTQEYYSFSQKQSPDLMWHVIFGHVEHCKSDPYYREIVRHSSGTLFSNVEACRWRRGCFKMLLFFFSGQTSRKLYAVLLPLCVYFTQQASLRSEVEVEVLGLAFLGNLDSRVGWCRKNTTFLWKKHSLSLSLSLKNNVTFTT